MSAPTPPLPDRPGETPESPRAAAPGSALASLRERRESALAQRHLDLSVPALPGIFVRYRPLEYAAVQRIQARHEKSKAADKDLVVNAAILATACTGIGELRADGTKVSVDPAAPDATWPRFDDRLADLLGLDPDGRDAVAVVRGLYVHDGPVLATAARLTEWSGYAVESVEDLTSGG